MKQLFRLALIFVILATVTLLVHQQLQIKAADYLISSHMDTASATTEWRGAADSTRLLLHLLLAGSVAALLYAYLHLLQSGARRPRTSMEALQPLKIALSEARKQEAEQREQKTRAIAKMTEIQAIHGTILDGMASGVVTVAEDGTIATCNPAARNILGWPGENPAGKPVGELFRGCLPKELKGDRSRPESVSRSEFEWRPPDHPSRHLGFSLSPVATPAGILTAVLFTDLTEMRRLKRQVELRRHLAQLGEVSAGIAHEFRNNMGAIMGYARLIHKDVPEGSPTGEVVDAMLGELSGMEHLIRDLLDFSRVEETALEEVPVEPLLHAAAKTGSADFDQQILVSAASGLPPLRADPSRLRQSLINLVRNACEAVHEHAGSQQKSGRTSVTLSAMLDREEGIATRPEWMTILIADTGEGIAEEERQKVFLPFYTTRESGTGMGLAQVHKTVTHHGGEIVLEETPGGGTTFRLRLPTIHFQPLEDTEEQPP